MPCGWEGNRRSGVALAMLHRNQRFIHLRAYGLRKADEHPAYTPRGVWHTLRVNAGRFWRQASMRRTGVRPLSVRLSVPSIDSG